jgi:uncharacterized delta-60 repeat protein
LAVVTAMLVVAACGSSSDSFVRNLALDWDQPGSFTDFGQYNGEVDYMDHDFKLAAPDEYPSPGDKWLGEKYLSPSFECKSDRLTVSMNAKTDVPVTEEQLALLDIELDETFSDFALARYKYNGKPESYFGDNGTVVTDGLQYLGLPEGPWTPGYTAIWPARAHVMQIPNFSYRARNGLALTDSHIYVWSLPRFGLAGSSPATDGVLLRYSLSGQPDKSFGLAGMVLMKSDFWASALDGQGNILIGTYDGWLPIDSNGDLGTVVGEKSIGADIAFQNEKVLHVAIRDPINGESAIQLRRYESDGSQDSTFAEASVILPTDEYMVVSKLLVSDDFIYVWTEFDEERIWVLRFFSNGKLDTDWGDQGIVDLETPYSNPLVRIYPVPTGGVDVYSSIFMPSDVEAQENPPVTITRLDSSGSVVDEQSFSGGPEGHVVGFGLPHLGGHLVVYGEYENTEIIRLDSTGDLDLSFGGTDSQVLGSVRLLNVKPLPDGSAIGLGQSLGEELAVLTKIDSEGKVDPSFGGEAEYRTLDRITDVALDGDRIFVVGNSRIYIDGPKRFWSITSYEINGDLDPGFGDNGVATKVMSDTSAPHALAIDSDGRIYVAGSADDKLALLRYQTNGALDSEFGQEGIVKASIAGRPAGANAVAVDGNQPVVGGYVQLGNRRYPAVQRYDDTGDLDPDFGYSGTVITKVGKSAEIHDLVIQGHNIIAVGHVDTPSGSDILVMRYNREGGLDPNFGKGGKVITDLGTKGDRANAVTLDWHGRIVVTGVRGGSDNDFVTLRYTSDGKLDSSFGTAGVATTDLGSPVEHATDVKVDSNQRIVVSGTTGKDNDAVFGVVRYKPNGFPDPSFGDDGVVTTNIGIGADHANGLVLLKGQLPIVVGSSIGAEWNELFPDYNVTIEGYFASAQKRGTKTTAQQAGTTADQLTLDIMYSTGKTKAVFLHVIRDEDTAEFEGAVQTTMYVEFDGPPSNRTCAVSMNFASTYQQPWK